MTRPAECWTPGFQGAHRERKTLSIHSLEHQRGIGPTETKRIRKHRSELRIVHSFADDRHVREYRIELADVGAFADEAILHHQQRIDRFLHAGSAERMAGQRLGGGNRRAFVARAEYLADRLDFRRVARGRGSRMWVDVVDLSVHLLQRHPHAALGTLARRPDYVGA